MQIKTIYQELYYRGHSDVRRVEMPRHILGDILENILLELDGIEDIARDSPPLFDYPSFIREISIYYMCCGIRSYILDAQSASNEAKSKRGPYTDVEWTSFTRQTQQFVRELFKLFLRRSTSIRSLNLAMQERDFCLRENPSKYLALDHYTDGRVALSKMRQFSSGGEGKQFCDILSKFCHNLESFRIVYNSGGEFDNLIKAQRHLRNLQVLHVDLTEDTVKAISTQGASLRSIELWGCLFKGVTLRALSSCRHLERIIFHDCGNMTKAVLAPLATASFPRLSTVYFKFRGQLESKDLPIHELAHLVANTRSTLTQLCIEGLGYPCPEIFESLVNSQQLRKISMQIQTLDELPLVLGILKTCKNLRSVSIAENQKFFAESFGLTMELVSQYLDANEFLPRVAQILSEQVQHLVLNIPNCWVTPGTLREFFKDCKANLEYLRWQSYEDSRFFVDVIDEYGRKMQRDVKYGNWKWEQASGQFGPVTLDVEFRKKNASYFRYVC
ncbi:5812_t:CDS:2 [Acaulospora colombiana]|uniref:5812_t:CDS:1 n=1 Tax=Acaulospora colombiana TaxID=27376 RepID=A0ACA9K444_9GLOM|nr:5812_t:CDS:2 [Acaulospora colombiana]